MKQVLLIIALLFSTATYAQVSQWTLQACMKYAVQHNEQVNKKSAQNSIHQQNYLEAIGRLLPTIEGYAGGDFKFGSNRDFNTQATTSVNSFSNSYQIAASLTLFDGMANINNLRMQRLNKVKGKYELQNQKDQIAYEVMQSYFNALYYMGTVDLSREQLAESEKAYTQINRMLELGLKSFADVAEAKAKLAEDRYKLTKQENVLKISIILLKEKMNFPIDEDLTIIDETKDIEAGKSLHSALSIYERAIGILPQALAAQSTADASKYGYRSAKGAWSPRISVNGGMSTSFFRYMNGGAYEPWRDQLNNNKGEYVGISINIPLFTGFSRSAKVKRGRAEMLIAQSDKEEILRKIYSDIEQAVADQNGQVDQMEQARQQSEAMTVAHKVNQRKYEEGLLDAIQVSTSANRLLNAKVEELNSRYMYQLKSKLVDYYNGTPYITE